MGKEGIARRHLVPKERGAHAGGREDVPPQIVLIPFPADRLDDRGQEGEPRVGVAISLACR
jgi:hypothetical protein